MQAVNTKSQCFVVWSDEIGGRLDAYYYSFEFQKLKTLRTIKTVEFKDLIEIITKGETPLWRGDSYLPSGIPFLKVQNISEEGIIGNIVYISEKVHNRMRRSQLFGGEMLYTMAGRIGTATILPENFGKTNINQAIAKIILKKGVNKEYIRHILNSDFGKRQAEQFLTTSAQPNINFEQIKSIKIPLPLPKIQNQIVEIMESAYKEKAEKEQKAEKLLNSTDDYVLDKLGIKIPEIKDKICFSVNSGDLNDNRIDTTYWKPRFQIIEKILKDSQFSIKGLTKIAKIQRGILISPKKYGKGKQFYIRIADLKNLEIDPSEVIQVGFEDNKGKVFENEILFTAIGATIGKIALISPQFDGAYFSNNLTKITSQKVKSTYLIVFLSGTLGQEQIKKYSTQTAQPKINDEELAKIKVIVPPLEIQNKIANEVKSRLEKAKKLKSEAKNIVKNAKKEVEKIILGK